MQENGSYDLRAVDIYIHIAKCRQSSLDLKCHGFGCTQYW